MVRVSWGQDSDILRQGWEMPNGIPRSAGGRPGRCGKMSSQNRLMVMGHALIVGSLQPIWLTEDHIIQGEYVHTLCS